MQWLQNLDVALFHWINPALQNSFFDFLMPFVSGNRFFAPAFFILALLLASKGGVRGRIFLAMLLMVILVGDSFICNIIKNAIARPRPFLTLTDIHIPAGIGKTGSGSMPSSHAANWFAATIVAFIYYRRTIYYLLPMALLVGFSRIYNGVHYPFDVLAGAILGAGYAACGVWTVDALWRTFGRKWFPLWWQRLPSLLNPHVQPLAMASSADSELRDKQWIRLAYILITLKFFANIVYIASGKIGLSEDEAYQWTWSKHLALSYYSKPFLIAFTQWAGTHIWGDTAFGVRFFSPVLAVVTAIVLFRFMMRVAGVRPAFWLSVVMPTIPLLSVGSILMTIDPLSVMFWIFAMIAGWNALQDDSSLVDWFWVGLWMGLGFLSKYTGLFQLLSWAVFFAIAPWSRKWLRHPGPYLALAVNLLCTLPVVIWNQQRDWITFRHVAEGGHFDQAWAFTFSNLAHGFVRYTSEFLGEELLLQNPFYFLPIIWALFAFWRYKPHQRLQVYLFSMGAPIFICYLLLTFHSRSLPNWIAPSILPFFCLATIFWNEKWNTGFRRIKIWLISGLVLGGVMVVLAHDTNLISKFTGYHVPPAKDSTRRVKGWPETIAAVEKLRQDFLAEGRPVFIICGHYGITGELSFYMPEARAAMKTQPLVYYITSEKPDNQFYFWPNYLERHGENALYIQEIDLMGTNQPSAPEILEDQFESVTDKEPITVMAQGQPVRRLQVSECRVLH